MKGAERFLLGAMLGAALAYALTLMLQPLARSRRPLPARPQEAAEAREEAPVA
ncbi:MAG: hypothetical protein Q7T33_00140 [Dehalococcoidia bacterium]|nr:hypothetical protein [Dehalococcoidia bacterium]